MALLILAVLVGGPLFAAGLPSGLIIGLPSTLVFVAIGMPAAFLVLAFFKISLQQGLDRNYELDREDQLQRRRVPKRLKSFPVRAVDVPDTDVPSVESTRSDEKEKQGGQTEIKQNKQTRVAG